MYNDIKVKISLIGFLSIALNFIAYSSALAQELDNDSVTIRYVDRPYGKVDFISNTAAVSSVAGTELNTPVNALSNALHGKIAGLTTVFKSGEPGYNQSTLYIRGLGSYNNNNLLVYVDGFEGSFDHLNPQEIESISVLKDAAALVPFGLEGANGILWVTTKRGITGKTKIEFQSRYGATKAIPELKFLDSYGYANLYNEAYSNDRGEWSPFYSAQELQMYKDGSNPTLYPNVNWRDESVRSSAPIYDMNLSFRGGSSAATYGVFLGYQNTDMLYRKDKSLGSEFDKKGEYSRYNFRANVDIVVNPIFSASADLGGAISDYITPTTTSGSIWENMALYPPNIYPVKNPNGAWGGSAAYMDNPVATLFATGRSTTHERFLQANIKLKQNLSMLTEGLSLTEAVSFNDYFNGYYNKIISDYERNQAYLDGNGDLQYLVFGQNKDFSDPSDKVRNVERKFSIYLTADYDRTFGAHTIGGRVGFHQKRISLSGINAPYFKQTFLAQFSYDYEKKYFAELAVSHSGSENFKKGNRFGTFPSISGSWVISNEKFMEDQTSINLLKLRASAGIVGNDNIGQRFLYQSYYGGNAARSYILGYTAEKANNTLAEKVMGNMGITWEKSHKYDLGVDFTLFKKLTGTVDLFYDKRTDIIAQRVGSVPAVYGNILPYENVGEVTNKGAEIELSFSDKIRDFNYRITGMMSYARNKIDYQDEVVRAEDYLYRTGRPVGQPFGMESVGFYQLEDFDSSGNLLSGIAVPNYEVEPGDLRYKDQNDDGFINEDDQIAIGYSNIPEIVYSFGLALDYKGFDFNAFFQGAANRSVYLNGIYAWAFVNNSGVPAMAENRWAYYPDQGIDTRATATYPRLTLESNDNNYQRSTFWTKNGAYLRLRSVELGYTLPAKLTQKIKIERSRFFIGGSNLLNWDKLDGYDAESISGYPLTKNYYVGINLSF